MPSCLNYCPVCLFYISPCLSHIACSLCFHACFIAVCVSVIHLLTPVKHVSIVYISLCLIYNFTAHYPPHCTFYASHQVFFVSLSIPYIFPSVFTIVYAYSSSFCSCYIPPCLLSSQIHISIDRIYNKLVAPRSRNKTWCKISSLHYGAISMRSSMLLIFNLVLLEIVCWALTDTMIKSASTSDYDVNEFFMHHQWRHQDTNYMSPCCIVRQC